MERDRRVGRMVWQGMESEARDRKRVMRRRGKVGEEGRKCNGKEMEFETKNEVCGEGRGSGTINMCVRCGIGMRRAKEGDMGLGRGCLSWGRLFGTRSSS